MDLEGGGASNLTGADRGRMWIGAVSPASDSGTLIKNFRITKGTFLYEFCL